MQQSYEPIHTYPIPFHNNAKTREKRRGRRIKPIIVEYDNIILMDNYIYKRKRQK